MVQFIFTSNTKYEKSFPLTPESYETTKIATSFLKTSVSPNNVKQKSSVLLIRVHIIFKKERKKEKKRKKERKKERNGRCDLRRFLM